MPQLEDRISTVTISCDTENVNITYTVNGGDSNVYTGPFDLEGYGAFTIVATASKEGYHTATTHNNISLTIETQAVIPQTGAVSSIFI